ncbi:16S rRNA (guanine(966)-N(2))-methyltransferase RsmD [Polaribacter sp. Hel1_33_78]|jgi:16S rRNA (guanine966-N2)-methyltransferase|uniref:RsmD family RNA methyltransferase n=1 Tax=unclassified Polaribacter TaxID=196858 RepID=UPI00087B1DBB|nr:MULTISPECIES: RsmD family RNA methyltransferase [unclassified Polaribacter]MBT3742269.1 methyltransferase [Polaribacter sp.]MBT4413336.1 methyltransferase [Polaribacter sp.]MBT7815374.1 methyltransferase [Polaribacter sp.]MDG1194470.1 RsmD family RNA methyltransferase [Polaribacter sp.]MDG1403449.1 RsmD family RNA methyltransferase [Polaribacter sp.]
MRIISGKLKGRRLRAPKNLPVRPTTDMAKEALFNIINNLYYFDSITVIDLFSGTGNISYEFASRGTKNIYAIDANYNCIKYISNTAKELNLEINTFKSDVYKFIDKTSMQADIIFADPPYDFEIEKFLEIVDTVFTKNILKPEGVLIIEHSKQTDLSTHKNHSYDKRYGGNVFSFFENSTEEDN